MAVTYEDLLAIAAEEDKGVPSPKKEVSYEDLLAIAREEEGEEPV